VLFRSADGTERGAAGTDPDCHTQRFAIGGPGQVGSDEPLARAADASLSLASVGEGQPRVIRTVRVQTGSAGMETLWSPTTAGAPTSFVVRVYTRRQRPRRR
jgi:hypothetical protein